MDKLIAVLNRMGDLLFNFFDIVSTIFNFILSLITFIVSIVWTLIKYIYRVFTTVFTDWFFDTLHTWLWQLEIYIWTVWTNILIVLLILVFAMIVFWFILKLMKWQLSYHNTESSLSRLSKTKK